MIIKIYPQNPNEKLVAQVADKLRDGAVVIYPTDGVYAMGCSLHNQKAVERLKTLSGKKESYLSVMCSALSQVSDYAKVDNQAFKMLKHNLPGPFTFILPASSKVPEKVLGKRKTVGIRIADNPVTMAIIRELGNPMATTSLKSAEDDVEYITDPELIDEEWGGMADIVIDGGIGGSMPTTLVDMTGDEPEVVREGAGELEY